MQMPIQKSLQLIDEARLVFGKAVGSNQQLTSSATVACLSRSNTIGDALGDLDDGIDDDEDDTGAHHAVNIARESLHAMFRLVDGLRYYHLRGAQPARRRDDLGMRAAVAGLLHTLYCSSFAASSKHC